VSRQVIGDRFELRELLGRGGMSEVWLAEDRDLGRPVALKLLAGGGDPARLVREARAIAALSHPHIAGLYDVGEAEGRPYLVLEYLPGGTLEDRLEDDRPLPDHETRRLAAQIAAGLAHAHASGIVHRDLKPSNILFDVEGRAKLGDFGIAQAAGQATLTEAGTIMGTAAYLSPEQAEGRPVGPATDVYSFGVLLYRLLTGRLPFTGQTALEVALKHQREQPVAVASIRPAAPADLAALAEHALAKNPVDRPRDGTELGALLAEPATAILPRRQPDDRTLVLGAPAPSREPASRRTGSRRLGLLVVALALLGGAGVLAAVLATGDGDTDRQLPSQTTARTSPGETTNEPTTTAEPTAEPTTEPNTTTEPTTTQPPTTQTEPTTATTVTTAPTGTAGP
jgi:eukaryotic-like serine/threonine-protein kinase